jgi:predicted  nucleic acid-binding Zn-ribbon protein
VISAIKETEARRNKDSRSRGMHMERNREPRILRNDERLMLGNGESRHGNPRGNPGGDIYVKRDEFLKEIGRIEGKMEQYRKEHIKELRDGFDRVDTQFQHIENTVSSNTESVKNLIVAVTKEVDDVQDVKEKVDNLDKRLNGIDTQLLKVNNEIFGINNEIQSLQDKVDVVLEILKK